MNKLLKTEQDKIEFLDWVATLEAGVVPQGGCMLESTDGFCCLGVGVALLVEEPRLKLSGTMLYGVRPSDQEILPDEHWLNQVNLEYYDKTDRTLTSLNDYDRLTFPRIAKKLMEAFGDELNE